MIKIKFFLLLVFFLGIFLFSNNCPAQTKTPSKGEITKLSKQATKYLRTADFEKSLATSRIALHYAIAIKDDYLIAKTYNIIAANCEQLSEFDKAIFYYNKGLLYANKTDNDTIKNWINNNLGNIYCFDRKEHIKGINYYKKALEYSQKTADTSQIVFTKLNIAWAYFDIGHFDEGFPYLEFSNKYHKKFGKKSTIVPLNMLNGMYYGHEGENKKATSYFLNALKLGNEGNEKSNLSYSHQEYSKFLLKNGNYKKAYENLALYNKITEKLYTQEKLKKANVAGINLELDEYKREVDKIVTEKELQYQSLRKSRIIVVLFIITLCVLLLLLYSLYKNYNFKKKANNDLTLANEELLVAKEKAEEASQLKTQFVSTISHELRTPLYGVVGITNMLLDEHKELAGSPHLDSLKFSARYLLSLVNDILHINKIEENRIVLENLAFNVSDEIISIKNSLSFIAQSHNNKISVEIDPKIPEFLIGDKLRLSQILMNLVSNALKFTKNGEVIVTANLIKVENKSHFVEFKIKDNGIGIADVDQDKVFEKFVQVGRKDNDYQGTGLGLAIVKRLLELFKSSISLESKIGVGTSFTFTIAFEYDPYETNEIINNIQVDLRSSQIFKILVVEDNKINQIVTKKIIEKNNCSCILVDDGFQAIEILSKESFDVILMDINMPLINGFETTRKIRQKGIGTPIIALTAFTKDEITEEAISAGMNDIMIKPFEPVKLFQVINDQITKQKTLTNANASRFIFADN
ncbi:MULTISPECIES: response regulator [unclassified Flavobacterium]|jgi:signal transduction histidine kinase/CheY-like chemotaxis protein|uniref:response regulator n=1 Tax=unclassified Flavobacterium TaxID=196869 RepID=UPI0025BA92A5|nr:MULTISPECIES: response regulator [unclassified Flavobacterium]